MGKQHWAKFSKGHAADLADNTGLPQWFRLYMFALEHVREDGHAHLEPDALKWFLGTKDDEGRDIPADRRTVSKVKKRAVKEGVLSPESTTTCLVVPREHARVGAEKVGRSICTRHGATKTSQKVSSSQVDTPTKTGQKVSPSQVDTPAPIPEKCHPQRATGPTETSQNPGSPLIGNQVLRSPENPAGTPHPTGQAPAGAAQGLALDGENSQIQSRPAPTTDTGDAPAWQPKDHHHRQAEQLGFPVDMARLTERFLRFHGHKHPAALDGLFTQWIAREKDTRPDWRKQQDAAREHAEKLWARHADDNHDGDRDPVAVGSILEHLPIAGRQHIAAARARRARAEQALRTA